MAFLSILASRAANGVIVLTTELQGRLAGILVGKAPAEETIPVLPILLVLAILIPLLVVAYKKFNR